MRLDSAYYFVSGLQIYTGFFVMLRHIVGLYLVFKIVYCIFEERLVFKIVYCIFEERLIFIAANIRKYIFFISLGMPHFA